MKKGVKWMRCGVKILLISLFIGIIGISMAQSTIIGEMSLSEEEIYQGEETTLEIKIENLRDQTLEDTHINIDSKEIEIEEQIKIGELRPGRKWSKNLKIRTSKNTPIGEHEIQGQLTWNLGSMKLSSRNLKIKEIPLKIETSFEKERVNPEEENSLTIKTTNKGEETLKNVEINPKFEKLAFIHTEEDCSRTYTDMNPRDSFETTCKFYASEQASRETELEIEVKFQDQDDKMNRFKEYTDIKVSTTILPETRIIPIILVGIAILLIFLKVKK